MMKRIAVKAAAKWPTTFFQGGISIWVREAAALVLASIWDYFITGYPASIGGAYLAARKKVATRSFRVNSIPRPGYFLTTSARLSAALFAPSAFMCECAIYF